MHKVDKFKFQIPAIDWDGIFGPKFDEKVAAFAPCNDGCGCTETCEADDKEELRRALADAAIELSTATRVLSDLIDRLYAEI